VRGSNRRPARIATPSGDGGCIVMRATSNGGASGRVCADTATKFPASKTSAANAKTVFHEYFQGIAILRSDRSFEWEFRQGIFLHPCARVSNQKSVAATIAEGAYFLWKARRTLQSAQKSPAFVIPNEVTNSLLRLNADKERFLGAQRALECQKFEFFREPFSHLSLRSNHLSCLLWIAQIL
jgi:hypothetical protein